VVSSFPDEIQESAALDVVGPGDVSSTDLLKQFSCKNAKQTQL
jgi:hypothetical protein